MRKLLWVVFLIACFAGATWAVMGPYVIENQFLAVLVVIFFLLHPAGAFWMLYTSVRYEKNPFPYVVLALFPYAFVWYYFERVRAGKLAGRPLRSEADTMR